MATRQSKRTRRAVPGFKLDPHLISTEPHELTYMKNRWDVKAKDLRKLIKEHGNGRSLIYRLLIQLGYVDSMPRKK